MLSPGAACRAIPRAHLVAGVAVWLVVRALGGQLPSQQSESLAFTSVTVIDVAAARRVPDQTVLVEGGRITRVGPASRIRVPAGARVVDGRGAFLIPGLIDTHVHLALADTGRDSVRTLGVLLSHGVTAVRDAGAGGRDAWLVAIRDAAARGELLSPRIYVSGMVAGRSVRRSGLADARALTRQLIALGVDGIKIRDGLTPNDVQAVLEEGSRARLPVYGHTYDMVGRESEEEYTLAAVRAGIAGIMHVSGIPQLGMSSRGAAPMLPRFGPDNWQDWWLYHASFWLRSDTTAERRLIEAMIERGVWLEPTLITEDWIANVATHRAEWTRLGISGSFDERHLGWPQFAGEKLERFRQSYGRMKDFVRRFHLAGGVTIAGTDCVPSCGFGLARELRLLVDAGLPPAAALKSATSDAARALRWADRVGRVTEGFAADLVLLGGDPLVDIGNVSAVRAVVANGRFLDRATLDSLRTGR